MKNDKNKVASCLLEIGSLLMSSGASTGRIRVIINRISHELGYNPELMITHRAIILTLTDEEGDETSFSRIKRIFPHGVNFTMVSGLSHLSWNITEKKWNLPKIEKEIDRLKSLPHYPRPMVLAFIGLADASFCYLYGGGWKEMAISFVATVIGLFVRQEIMKRKFNPYIGIYMGASVAAIIASSSVYLPFEIDTHKALATCVLYLIPGIPLINSITDLIDGNILNGVVRGTNCILISFAIALGLLTATLIFNI